VTEVDVYVDDFIAVAQGDHKRLKNVRATVLHAIDSIFRPNDERDPLTRAEPVSLKNWTKAMRLGALAKRS
jgi:mannose-6-phosphate isomerase-like protein (cupin superfamily)